MEETECPWCAAEQRVCHDCLAGRLKRLEARREELLAERARLVETITLLKYRAWRLVAIGEQSAPNLRHHREWLFEKEGIDLR